MVCKYWREYDDDYGSFEYCNAKEKKTACCGSSDQCFFFTPVMCEEINEKPNIETVLEELKRG